MSFVFDEFREWVSGEWWSYAVLFAVSAIDAFFPVVPSESLVITAGTLASSGDLWLPGVILSASAGAVQFTPAKCPRKPPAPGVSTRIAAQARLPQTQFSPCERTTAGTSWCPIRRWRILVTGGRRRQTSGLPRSSGGVT